jgi:hypothetical protein
MRFSDEFIRKAFATGAIVPPPNEERHASACRTLARVGWIMALLGVVALAVAYYLKP